MRNLLLLAAGVTLIALLLWPRSDSASDAVVETLEVQALSAPPGTGTTDEPVTVPSPRAPAQSPGTAAAAPATAAPGKLPATLEALGAELQKNPHGGPILDQFVAQSLAEKRGQAAVEFLEKLADKHPDNVPLQLAVSDLLVKTGQTKVGLERLERATQQKETAETYLPYLGMMYLNQGEPRKAVEAFRTLVDKKDENLARNPKDAVSLQQAETARLDLANSLIVNRSYGEAEMVLNGILSRRPGDRAAIDLMQAMRTVQARDTGNVAAQGR